MVFVERVVDCLVCRHTHDYFHLDCPLVRSGLIKILKPGEWPPYSPDLNLMENLMAAVKVEVHRNTLPQSSVTRMSGRSAFDGRGRVRTDRGTVEAVPGGGVEPLPSREDPPFL